LPRDRKGVVDTEKLAREWWTAEVMTWRTFEDKVQSLADLIEKAMTDERVECDTRYLALQKELADAQKEIELVRSEAHEVHAELARQSQSIADARRQLEEAHQRTAELERRMQLSTGHLLCGGCGGPHNFDTSVPSVVWNSVIRVAGMSEYLCTSCIVRAFVEAGVSFTATLWSGDIEKLNGVPIEVRVSGEVARDAARISEENTALRVESAERGRQLEALLGALRIAQGRMCERLCMTHPVLSTFHHPDCQDMRDALKPPALAANATTLEPLEVCHCLGVDYDPECRFANATTASEPPPDSAPAPSERDLANVSLIDHIYEPCTHESGMCTKYKDPINRCHYPGCGGRKENHREEASS
jgi:hypothetical protein